jgi:ribonuclease HI
MYFDGSLMKTGAGADLLFISPLGKHLRYVLRFHFPASNNVAEYEALVNGVAHRHRARGSTPRCSWRLAACH